MATRFYLPAQQIFTPPISPTPSASWEDASILLRTNTSTSKVGDTLTGVSFTDADDTDKDVLFRQYISEELTAGQTITGSQSIKAQVRGSEVSDQNNMFLAIGIRVIASDGSTVRKTILDVTRDDVEFPAATPTNRQFTATGAAGDYTVQSGDYLVIEIGAGGDPIGSGSHDSSLRLGDSAASDLSEDDTSTTDNNPWIEFTDTLTFGVGGHDYSASDSLGIKDEGLEDPNRKVLGPLSLGVSDDVLRAVTALRALSDAFAFSDTTATSVQEPTILTLSATDNLAFSDDVLSAMTARRLVSDDFALSDDVAWGILWLRTLEDQFAFTDSVSTDTSGTAVASRSVSDSLGLSDDLERQVDVYRSILENLALDDSVYRIPSIPRVLADSFALDDSDVDAVAYIIARLRILDEMLGIADEALQPFVIRQRHLSDAFAISDVIIKGLAALLTIQDNLGLSDSETHLLQRLMLLVDNLALDDATLRQADVFREISDLLAIDDAVLRSTIWLRVLDDQFAFQTTADAVRALADYGEIVRAVPRPMIMRAEDR